MYDPSEKEIIIKIKRGEINYFEILVKKYSSKMLSYVRQKVKNSEDAEDIVQNSFIKAYKSIDSFNGDKSFSPWFYTIVNHEVSQFFRDNPEYLPLDDNWQASPSAENNFSISFFEIIKTLKPEYQKVVKLYASGYTYREISKIINRPINTVKTLLRRGRILLKMLR